MRAKKLRLIVTFHTTTAAMAMEKHCMENGVPGRLIPVPRAITAGCGMSWSTLPEARVAVEAAVATLGDAVDRFYELEI